MIADRKIKAIVACTQDGGIGSEGRIPWASQFAEDLKWFQQQTMGDIVVMGRVTWETLPTKPLPGRTNIILSNTRQTNNRNDEVWVTSVQECLDYISNLTSPGTVWIIGGAGVYKSFFDTGLVDEVVVTEVYGSFMCDTHIILPKEFELVFDGALETSKQGIVYCRKRYEKQAEK